MTLLKNKIFLLVIVLVLLLTVATAGFKAFSLYSFNTFTKELDSGNKSLFTSFKNEIITYNKILENLTKSANFGVNFSKEKNSKYSNQAKADYDKLLVDYKKGLEELKSESADLDKFTKLPLWLSTDQKKFASDINSALDQYSKARENDYEFQTKTQPIFNNVIQTLNDTFVFIDYSTKAVAALASATTMEEIATAFEANISDISSLEKYTRGSYKFDGQNELSAEFPDSYKEFELVKKIYAQSYTVYQAIAKGDLAKIDELAKTDALFYEWSNSSDGALTELAAKQIPYTVKIKDAYINYAKTLDYFSDKNLSSNLLSKEKVLTQNNQNKLVIFAYLVELYSLENGEGTSPKDTDFISLLETLKTGNHFDKALKYNKSDFTYTSDGDNYYELGYKDEISGQMSSIVIGNKKDTETTLGVITKMRKIKVEDKEIDLEFINDIISSFDSLLPAIPR